MREKKVFKIDFSRDRLRECAERYYDEGNYLSALRFTYRELDLYGGDGETYTRLSDIYENMQLYSSAVNCWYRFLDGCSDEELPDVYEGLAVNYLNMGNEAQSAFYYNKLLETDDDITEEEKEEIATAFSRKERNPFRFVYPPRYVDYSETTEAGAHALKNGHCRLALTILSDVEKGSSEYARAREMQAVAYLLSDKPTRAEKICRELIRLDPDNVQALATLAAVYTEEGRREESRTVALRLCAMKLETPEELYKVATVCCENGMHEEAFQKFCELERYIPYDGNMLYFKAVAAYLSGRRELALTTLETLCTVYPDAAVAEYYLKELRRRRDDPDADEPEMTYFYRVPKEEKARRCRALARIRKYPRSEAELFGSLAEQNGFFRWCFDEMDGMEKELQFLAIVVADHARADSFLRDVLLDCEVSDVLKLELLRLLFARNEENSFGTVVCNIYRRIFVKPIAIGRKRRSKFVNAYAQLVSKFVVINDGYASEIRVATEKLYRAFADGDLWAYAESENDLACAVYLLSGLKELGTDLSSVLFAFGADKKTVNRMLALFRSAGGGRTGDKKGKEGAARVRKSIKDKITEGAES